MEPGSITGMFEYFEIRNCRINYSNKIATIAGMHFSTPMINHKARILITVSFSFSIRYLYRTGLINKLREFFIPVIVLTWNQEDIVEELRNDGFEVHVISESVKGKLYANVREKIDFYFRFIQLKSPSKNIQAKYLDQYRPVRSVILRRIRQSYNQLKFLFPFNTKKVFEAEKNLLSDETNFNAMLEFVDRLQIDAVFTPTPFQSQEDILLRACKQRGKFMIASILSFDNITKRGWIPVDYDVYMVWNKYNFNELLRSYHAANEHNTFITGAAQFDFYFHDKYLLAKNDWENLVGLQDNKRKVILYAGGPKSLFPNEMQYLQHLDKAIDEGKIKGNPVILFRCHPMDKVERWKEFVGTSDNIIYDVSWTGSQKMQYSNITVEDINKLCSTLAYTDVHINLCSTMAVDGSAYNKPQVGPAYDEINPDGEHLLQDMYLQEHFIPVMKVGGISLSKSKNEFIELVNDALQNPSIYITRSQKILDEVISFSDGKGTDRIVEVIRRSLNTHLAA